MPLHLRIGFVRQIADALRYAHGRRVIHRALSPQSILLTGAHTAQPQLKIFNWQADHMVGSTSGKARRRLAGDPELNGWDRMEPINEID